MMIFGGINTRVSMRESRRQATPLTVAAMTRALSRLVSMSPSNLPDTAPLALTVLDTG